MRWLAGIPVILAVLWGGYWFIGQRAVENGFETWLESVAAQGADVRHSGLNTTGFPNRFDTTIRDISVFDHSGALGWQSPFLQIFALSYKPHHVIAVWPEEQSVTIGGARLIVTSDDMRGSVVFRPGSGLAPDRGRLEIKALETRMADGADGPVFGVTRVMVASRRAAGQLPAHDLAIEASALTLAPGLKALLDPQGALPETIDGLTIDATLGFDGEIGIMAPNAGLTRLEVRKARLQWADVSLSLEGALGVDARGFAEGTLTLDVQNWEQMFDILVAAGVVDPVWKGALRPLAENDGPPDALTTDLRFADGVIRFGPLPLWPAPRVNRGDLR